MGLLACFQCVDRLSLALSGPFRWLTGPAGIHTEAGLDAAAAAAAVACCCCARWPASCYPAVRLSGAAAMSIPRLSYPAYPAYPAAASIAAREI